MVNRKDPTSEEVETPKLHIPFLKFRYSKELRKSEIDQKVEESRKVSEKFKETIHYTSLKSTWIFPLIFFDADEVERCSLSEGNETKKNF